MLPGTGRAQRVRVHLVSARPAPRLVVPLRRARAARRARHARAARRARAARAALRVASPARLAYRTLHAVPPTCNHNRFFEVKLL